MYFFNQGQALEQYYISIRNTIQLKLIHTWTTFPYAGVQTRFATGWQKPFPLLCIRGYESYLKGSEGKTLLVQVKTSLVKILSPLPSLLMRIIKSDMQMELENKSLFRRMPHSHHIDSTDLKINK